MPFPSRNTAPSRIAQRSPRIGLTLRLTYVACLLGATVNHGRIVAAHGILWDYGGVPTVSAAFWTSLTVLDPLAIILLVMHPNAGVIATVAIIVSDVIHNVWITARYAAPGRLTEALTSDLFLLSQIVFLLFVVTTAKIAWTQTRLQNISGHN